jgi:hypothetical protein
MRLSTGLHVLALGICLALPVLAADTSKSTGELSCPRYWHTATLLKDGRVLVVGGCPGDWKGFEGFDPKVCEIFDPVKGAWSPAASLPSPRVFHTATLLKDGRVFVTGGCRPEAFEGAAYRDAWLYDPGKDRWDAGGSLPGIRGFHTATLLKDGRVLVAGGADDSGRPVKGCLIYDCKGDTWTPATALKQPRWWHQAVGLPDGRVLALGGFGGPLPEGAAGRRENTLRTAEVYDSGKDAWEPAGKMVEPRAWTNAAALPDGSVLVAGGWDGFEGGGSGQGGARAERWLSAKGFGEAGTVGEPPYGRFDSALVVLADGSALITGGFPAPDVALLGTCERFDGKAWKPSVALQEPRVGHTATLLKDGRVLVAGGSLKCCVCRFPATDTCELLDISAKPR